MTKNIFTKLQRPILSIFEDRKSKAKKEKRRRGEESRGRREESRGRREEEGQRGTGV